MYYASRRCVMSEQCSFDVGMAPSRLHRFKTENVLTITCGSLTVLPC